MKKKYKINFTYLKRIFRVISHEKELRAYFIVLAFGLIGISLYSIIDTRRSQREFEREVQKINEHYREKMKEMKTKGIFIHDLDDIDSAYDRYKKRLGMDLR